MKCHITHENNMSKKPLLWSLIAGLTLLTVYFLILTVVNSFSHAIEQFTEMWYWISFLVIGFGIQAGLYSYIRMILKKRKEYGTASASVAVAGGISTTSMVACCVHHITDVLPVLGLSAAVIFLNQFQTLFIVVGVLSNLIGITLMLKIIQGHNLYHQDQRVFSVLMKLNMTKSFYAATIFSAVIFLATLYKGI